MGSLRWKYNVDTYVEDTQQRARERGFSAFLSEGQSKTGSVYPLNQVELWGGNFDPRIKVVVSPHVTQIYFSVVDVPSIDELETVLNNLDKVESILNEIVVFTPNENVRFSENTRRPIMEISMLKTTKLVEDVFNDAIQMGYEFAIKEHTKGIIALIQGKPVATPTPLKGLVSMLTRVHREATRMAKEKGNENAEKYEKDLNDYLQYSNLFEAEIAMANSQDEIRKIIEKYSSKLFDFS